MSSDTEAVSTDALLTDQQRIEKLEKAGKLNRLLIFGLAGALLLTLLTWLLVALLSSSAEEAAEDQAQLASLASVEALQKELGALQLQIAPLQQQIKDQQKLILLQAQQQMAPPAEAATGDAPAADETRERDRENVRMLARTLIGQENNYQHTLNALKEGMRELAGMTPGSRSWLDFYEESLAKPMADSQARVKALQKWSEEQSK
ncbi:hypothetical protein [Pseudomonas sp. SO81]|uniref:hypothetical protein n=1 Tax=Pseudomonas sp. SO81 TaxID=2983246 RepID=UPI0025A4703D|nr:hypothetical protein [Pseudomonas sp. SO81]WJN61244.1 hypothetical protein OH686_21055 [Pseudomonas sp. SO81]